MSEKATAESSLRRFNRWDAAFFLAAFVFLYTQLFQLPFTPYYFEGDHLLPVSNAMRLIAGEVMYRDFFHLTPPGAELWYASLFSIFGVRVWLLNFTILLLNLGVAGFAWYFSRRLFDGAAVYLAPALHLIVGFRMFYVDGSYRLFSVLLAFAAVASMMRGSRPRRIVSAGVFCGLASFFVQPRGVMALLGVGLFLVWEHFRGGREDRSLFSKALYLVLPFAATVALTHAYFAWTAGFDNYYFSLVTFVQKHYPNDPLSNRDAFLADLPDLGQYLSIYTPIAAVSRYLRVAVPGIFFYALVPWTYLVFFLFRWRRRTWNENAMRDRLLMLLGIAGLALAAGISAPGVVRLAHVAVPAIIIFVWLIGRLKFAQAAAAVMLIGLSAVGAAYVVQRQTAPKHFLDMPAGRAAFLSEQYFRRYEWIGANTSPGDAFYEGHHPSYYFPFHLRNPTPMYLLRDSDYSPQFQVDGVLSSLRAHPPEFIAWPRKWTKPAGERLPGDNLNELSQFIHANYEPRIVFDKPLDYTPYSEGDIEIWRRKF